MVMRPQRRHAPVPRQTDGALPVLLATSRLGPRTLLYLMAPALVSLFLPRRDGDGRSTPGRRVAPLFRARSRSQQYVINVVMVGIAKVIAAVRNPRSSIASAPKPPFVQNLAGRTDISQWLASDPSQPLPASDAEVTHGVALIGQLKGTVGRRLPPR
jgi:hypothetical protein